MNSGRALVLILLVGIALVVAFAIFTFSDSDPIGPSGPDDEGEVTDPGRDAPRAVEGEKGAVTGRIISGRDKKPVADAEISIGEASGRTDDKGQFALKEVPEGERTLVARAKGSLELAEKVKVAGKATELGDLVLPWPTVLTGTVTDLDARPVGGATVRILSRSEYKAGGWFGPAEDQIRMGIEVLDEGKPVPGLRTKTDAAGKYRVEGIAAGEYFVSAGAPGHSTADRETIEVPESSEAKADISLGAPSTISGRVLEGETGVDGAVLMITPWSRAQEVPYRIMERTVTTAGGKFRVDSLVSGTKYLVIARAPSGKVGIMIQIPAPKEDLVVKVGPRFNLNGIVTDKESGEVIKGARLWTILARGESGEDGRYELKGMVKHLFFKYVWIEAEGYDDEQAELTFMERMGSDIEKNFQLTKLKPGTLIVSVLDVNGGPVADAAVTVRKWREKAPIATATTDELGRATLTGIFQQGVRVAAEKKGYTQVHLATERSGQQIAYPQEYKWANVPAEETQEFEVDMITTSVASGVVRDRQGQALPGVTVATHGGKLGVTDAKGTFQVEGAPAGLRTQLIFYKAGYVTKYVPLEANLRSGLQVELARGGTIDGIVVDDTGKPVGGVNVQAEVGDFGFEGSAKTGPDGRFKLEGLEPGDYSLTARRAEYAATKVAGFALDEAQTIDGVKMVLTKGLKVELKLYHPDGSEVAGSIYVHGPMDGPKDERILRNTTRRGGDALTLQLKPGRYQILASPSGQVEGAGAVDYEHTISSAGEVRIELSSKVLRLLIRPRVQEGSRVGSFRVTRTEPADPNVSLWMGVEEDGSFRSPPLPAGKYQVAVWYQTGEGDAWTYKEFEGLEPGDKVHDVDLTKK